MASCFCIGKRKGCTCNGRCACACTCSLNQLQSSVNIKWEETPVNIKWEETPVDLKKYPWDLPNLPPNCL